jgi:hypothetical protein
MELHSFTDLLVYCVQPFGFHRAKILIHARAVNNQNSLEITKKWLRPLGKFG